MKLKLNKCQICGGTLKDMGTYYRCESCDAEYRIDDTMPQEEMDAYYKRMDAIESAERNLEVSPPRFDDAEEEFELITKRYPECSAGYWGLLRAKFGIKFERDSSGKAVPSCYKSEYYDFRDMDDYKNAIAHAETPELKSSYENMAEYIARVAKEWREEAQKYDYDVFISCKVTDDSDGSETSDARDIRSLYYTFLTKTDYKVFYSQETLRTEGYGGKRSEPYIFNALDKADVLIVYGSKKEYFTSTWVQNEWQRYLRAMERGQKSKDSLIVLYKGFNPKELPKELRSIQAIDLGRIDASLEILNAVEKIFERVAAQSVAPAIERIHIQSGQIGKKAANAGESIATVELGASVARKSGTNKFLPVKMRELGAAADKSAAGRNDFRTGENLLNSEFYEDSITFFNKCLVQNDKNGDAWLGKMCAQMRDAKLYSEILAGNLNPARPAVKFSDLSVLQNAIDYARDKTVAENLLAFVYNHLRTYTAGCAFSAGDISYICSLYEMCADYNSQNVKNIHKLLLSKADKFAKAGATKLVDLLLGHIADVDSMLAQLTNIVDACMAGGDFKNAKIYNDRAAALDETDGTILFDSFLITYRYRGKDEFINNAERVKDLGILQNGIMKLPKAGAERILEVLCAAERNLLAKGSFKAAQYYFGFISKYNFKGREGFLTAHSEYFGKMAAAGEEKFFEEILAVYPDRSTDFHIGARLTFADVCRADGKLDMAETMYDGVLELEDGNSAALQGKLLCTLNVSDLSGGKINWNKWDTALFERVLSSLPTQKAQADLVNKMCRACITSIKDGDKLS